jgi:hypothetical protein
MSITAKDEQNLDALVNQYHKQAGSKRREDFFPLLYIPKKFNCAVEDILPNIAFGNNDYGIDAYYIDRLGRNLYLYQFKWSENPHLFRDSLERLASDGIQRIFGNSLVDPAKNEVLRSLRATLNEAKSFIERVYIHFVFKGDIEKANSSAGLNDRKEHLENRAHYVETFFGRPVPMAVEFIADRGLRELPRSGDTHNIALDQRVDVQIQDSDIAMHVGFVHLIDLLTIYRDLGPKFFDRNVRAGLSPDNPPNRKIREALTNIVLKKTELPEFFSLHHNGVTIAVESVSFSEGRAILKVPRLLNGAQTVTSFAKFMDENADHPALKSGDPMLSRVRVLAKLVVADPFGEMITKVTLCNNQQNPVHPWNLRANDRIQCDLQDKFKADGFYYSRQENAIAGFSEDDLEIMGITDDRPINIRPLAQTFLASQGEIANMSRLREVFEDQKLYENTFRKAYLNSDTAEIILSYKAGLMLNPVLRRMDEKAAAWLQSPLRRARNLVWALLIQGILNDPKLADIKASWGISLTREREFAEYLAGMGSNRILTLLREVFSDDTYKDKLAQNRYDFVTTKETFKRCMTAAEKAKHPWKRLSL